MTEIIWQSVGLKHRVETCLMHTQWMVGDLMPIVHHGQRLLLRVEERVVPVDQDEIVQLRCVIAAEEVRARICGEDAE
jgi:hypothetical protein